MWFKPGLPGVEPEPSAQPGAVSKISPWLTQSLVKGRGGLSEIGTMQST